MWEKEKLKTMWEKEKLLVRAISPFPTMFFYSFGGVSAIFIETEIVVCKLFQFRWV